MARNSDQLANAFEADNTGGVLSGFLAEEDQFDRRALWRLGSWGIGSLGAVIIAMLANQSSLGLRRDPVAAADRARQAEQIQSVAKESQNETRRLASAIDTLNGDRDRLYSRVTVLEQGLDSVTGAIARQNATATGLTPSQPVISEPQAAPQDPAPAPLVSSVVTAAPKVADKTGPAASEASPATVSSVASSAPNPPEATLSSQLMAFKSIMAPPDAGAAKLIKSEAPASAVIAAPMPEVVAAASSADFAEPDASQAAPARIAVRRTEFGVDVGGANSLGGLRALWRGLLKSRSNAALTTLRPIIVIREGSGGLGMHLRLVAGPLDDAAAAAKICAGLIENERPCETAVFDGQSLAMKADDQPAVAAKSAAAKPALRQRSSSKRAVIEEPANKPESSALSSLFGKR